MGSLEAYMPNPNIPGDEQKKKIHIIYTGNRLFTCKTPSDLEGGDIKCGEIECGDIIEFEIDGKYEYDVFQVYKDGDDYYRIDSGYELINIKSRTPKNDRRMLLSLALDENQSEIDLYLCVILSSDREKLSKTRRLQQVNFGENIYPVKCYTINRLTIKKRENKIFLQDEEKNEKVYLNKGDTIKVEWLQDNNDYRIEEKKYCPISGGLYTVEQTSNTSSSKREYKKTFNEFGISFLFRLNDKNQIHDITVCVINDTYKIKYIQINDNNIQPNIIRIEQNDWIIFQWNTVREQTIVQIEPFHIDQNEQQSIEVCIL
jgi:hypothetical protein